MSDIAQNQTRDLMPDLIRAFALIGIVLVNVEAFSSGYTGYSNAALDSALSQTTIWLVAGLFTMKSYSLFSMMFGAGLGYQLASSTRSSQGFSARYFRRMAGLLALGLLHAIFLFIGDILVSYAILGCFFFLFRNSSTRTLITWSAAFILFQTILLLAMSGALSVAENTTDPALMQITQKNQAREAEFGVFYDQIMAGGNFLDLAALRASVLTGMLGMIFMVQGIAAFGFFLIGLAFYQTGLLSAPSHPFWRLCRLVLFPIGLIASLSAARVFVNAENHSSAQALLGLGLIMAASTLSSLGYVGWIAKLCDRPSGPVLRFIARGGQATLSAYILQSVILCFVFLDFGLGLFGKLSGFEAVMIALATGILSLCFTSLWRKAFKRGPLEILLRRWTYLGDG